MYSIVPYLTNLQVLVYTCTEVVRVLSTVLSYCTSSFLVLQYVYYSITTATATATAAVVIADYRSVTVLR